MSDPADTRRDIVLVSGAPRAGVSSLVEAMRSRMPKVDFVEHRGPGRQPDAVLFVASAAAPLTRSGCELLDAAARCTDSVIAVLSKIDVHRGWRECLRANREAASAHRHRYRALSWVGVAAAPGLGDCRLEELIDMLTAMLSEPDYERRNQLRSREFDLESAVGAHRAAAAGSDRRRRIAQLRADRARVSGQTGRRRSAAAGAMRERVARARVELSFLGARQVSSLRADVQQRCAALSRRAITGFPADLAIRVTALLDEIGERTEQTLAGIAEDLDLPGPPPADPADRIPLGTPARGRGLETRLMLLLGAGFGLGVAMTLARVFAGLAPGWAMTIGGVLTVWVVGMRALLADRAVLERWANDTLSGLRPSIDREVTTRIVAAEAMWTECLRRRDEGALARVAEEVRTLDTELAVHTRALERAGADHDREMPVLGRELRQVRAELSRYHRVRPGEGPLNRFCE